MAVLTNTVQFSGEEARSYILEPTREFIQDRGIIAFTGGIKAKQQVVKLGKMDKITQKDSGCDNPPTPRGTIPRSEEFWDPQKQEAYTKYCVEEAEGQLEQYALAAGVDYYKLEAMEQKALFYDLLFSIWQSAMRRDFQRLYWLGDLDILAAALTAGAPDVVNYDTVDGFWKRIAEGVTATTIKRHDISALQSAALTDDGSPLNYEAPGILKAVERNADPRLRNLPKSEKVYLVTGEIWDNQADYYEAKGKTLSQETGSMREENGQDILMYHGIDVINEDIWDEYIPVDFAPAAAIDRRHRVILTAKNNLHVGMNINDESQVADYEVHYDWLNKTNHIFGRYKMDTKINWNHLVSVAY